MKPTTTALSFTRAQIAKRPSQEEINAAKEKANRNITNQLRRTFEPEIYTR